MTDQLKRRAFIAALGGTAAGWPLAARAQQTKVARIGFLGVDSASSHAARLAALRAGLRDLGWLEGTNLLIEYRWAEGNYERLRGLADELVQLKVDVLVTHSTPGALAAKSATSTIPIVLTAVADPLALGLVSSLRVPGGNITGLSTFTPELMAKRLQLLKEAVPALSKAALLINPDNPLSQPVLQEIEPTAKALNIAVQTFEARRPNDFGQVFATMIDQGAAALLLFEDPVMIINANALAVFAAVNRLPSCGFPELARAGGLIALGINFPDMEYRAAAFVDKILKGAKPGELPIERATKFNIILNLQTAKALGINMPPSLLAPADEVIE
jgi:putative tryptophan/tyrosine transport system substrate-binding protein